MICRTGYHQEVCRGTDVQQFSFKVIPTATYTSHSSFTHFKAVCWPRTHVKILDHNVTSSLPFYLVSYASIVNVRSSCFRFVFRWDLNQTRIASSLFQVQVRVQTMFLYHSSQKPHFVFAACEFRNVCEFSPSTVVISRQWYSLDHVLLSHLRWSGRLILTPLKMLRYLIAHFQLLLIVCEYFCQQRGNS